MRINKFFNTSFILAFACAAFCLAHRAEAKGAKADKIKCAEELSSYKLKNGKSELGRKKAGAVCNKNSSEKFLACVAGTKRHLVGLDEAIKFCKKNPTNSQQMCAQNLSSYKTNGARDIPVAQISNICERKQASKFVDCIGLTQRTFGSTKLAVDFCKKNPSTQKQACVNELGAMKDRKSRKLAQGKKLGELCMKNSSVAFLDCVAKSRSTKVCVGSGRSPKANRVVASNSSDVSEGSIVLRPKQTKRLPKKVIRE